MGALHEGHLSLVQEARQQGDFVVVTIFVNPTQFSPGEDLARYPRTLDRDVEKLEPYKVDAVFVPTENVVYPEGFDTYINVGGITEGLCGAHRPNHFRGVATIVAKLFNMVGPCLAFFGRKDYQQLMVIRKMVRDLNMPIDVRGMPTVRESDGLAKSSRNAYLGEEERNRSLSLAQGLAAAHAIFGAGERSAGALRRSVLAPVEKAMDSIDYITIADPDSLRPFGENEKTGERVLIALAAHIGTTRLIDNTVLGEDNSPL
jgi:pantoate--beta-alanine ligase